MALLTSGLETIEYGTQGWSAIQRNNMQLLDTKLVNVLSGNAKILGAGLVVDPIGSQADPAAQTSATLTDSTGGTAGATLVAAGVAYTEANINDNFASVGAQVNNLVAEVTNIIAVIIGHIDYTDSNKAKIIEMLAELRKSTGNGVFGG